MNKRKLAAYCGVGISGIATVFATIYLLQPEATRGMSVVTNFNGQADCTTITPECGYCPGKILADKCYVDPKNLTDAEKANIRY